ncbi:hypothetical protein AB1N83_006266 [Pleurotus pulmonarius]
MANPASTHIIDDSDPRIQYSVGWRRGGRDDEFNTTTTLTSTHQASFTLKFAGTAISVFGTADSPNNSTFEVDGASASQCTVDTKGKRIPGILFYESPTLPLAERTLVGTNVDKKVILDYLVITSPSDILATSTSTASGVAFAGTSSSSGPCAARPCTPKEGNISATNRNFIIVGCVLAAVALAGLIWVLWSIWRAARAARGSEERGAIRPYSVACSSSNIREKRSR